MRVSLVPRGWVRSSACTSQQRMVSIAAMMDAVLGGSPRANGNFLRTNCEIRWELFHDAADRITEARTMLLCSHQCTYH